MYCQSNACVVIEKKKGPPWSYFLALHFGLYSLLFVCFNKHTRTRVQNFKLCCKFMFRQILSSNFLQILRLLVEENGLKVCQCWPHATVSPCMPSNSKSPTLMLCMCSDIFHPYEFLMSKKHKCLTIWCLNFTVDAASRVSLTPIKPTSFYCLYWGEGIKAQFDFSLKLFLVPEGSSLLFKAWTLTVHV